MPHGYPSRGVQDVAAVIPQFGTGFRPEFNGIAPGNSLTTDQQKAGLSLWLNQSNSHINPTDIAANYASSSSTGLPEMVQMGSANLYGSSSTANFGNLTLSGLPHVLKEEVGNKGNMVDTSSSLYSDNQNKQSKPAAPMSATALLQKAAQMGSTRSNNQSFFGNSSYGVMSSSSSNTTNLNSLNQNRNELQQVFQNVKQPESTLTATSSVAMGDATMGTSSNNLDQLVMQTSGKQSDPGQLNLQRSSNSIESGLTRDFLGISGESVRPFLTQELAKFASMSSAMGLTQFTRNP